MYQVLYRKWRPKTFEDVSGQPQVTVTLKNELQSGRINHAYLFTGSRGTGKTTCAKILAKAVNCLAPVDGNPCGECEICTGIDEGTVLDVSEIDAASNNGVDNIRTIIDQAAFTPAKARYRVYIIDEVHMLSAGAFNALLKTLEEPPSHVVFILATTEVHKLPATILSRCQRFDFRRIPPEDIAERLEYVAAQEAVQLDHQAAMLIAVVSDGALRDALSLLDRCMGVDSTITSELVRSTAGLAGRDHLFEITACILDKDSGSVLDYIEKLHKDGKDMARLCEELVDHFRSLMLLKTMKTTGSLVVMSPTELKKAREQSDKLTLEEIIYYMDTLQLAYDRMFKGGNKRTEMELCLIKLARTELDDDKQAILARLARLERAVKNGVVPVNECNQQTTALQEISQSKAIDVLPSVTEAENAQPIVDVPVNDNTPPQMPVINKEPVDLEAIIGSAKPMDDWQEVLDVLKTYSQTIAASFRDTDAYISGDYLLIDAKSDIPFKLLKQSAQRDKMRVAVKEVTGRTYRLGPYKKPEQQQAEKDPLIDFTAKLKDSGVNVNEVNN
ncbi:MAG TPA: DNA polymerase III subunit gamma/tau [Clostridiales bacterium]|nr:DNA polymerase III subunit gamma/tau [Clostridiales bacterium]